MKKLLKRKKTQRESEREREGGREESMRNIVTTKKYIGTLVL